jgi:hypothetical protein
MASVAGAVVWMGGLPVKLNPVIQPLMAAIKREQVSTFDYNNGPISLLRSIWYSMYS